MSMNQFNVLSEHPRANPNAVVTPTLEFQIRTPLLKLLIVKFVINHFQSR